MSKLKVPSIVSSILVCVINYLIHLPDDPNVMHEINNNA
jgi:hypothetical protein